MIIREADIQRGRQVARSRGRKGLFLEILIAALIGPFIVSLIIWAAINIDAIDEFFNNAARAFFETK
jgi:hypothetical protein